MSSLISRYMKRGKICNSFLVRLLFIFAPFLSTKGNPLLHLKYRPATYFCQLKNYSPKKVIHIKDFGAIGDGKTNCTRSFQEAAAYLQTNGGNLIIDPGTYIVGKQKFTGSFGAGSSYIAEPILNLKHVEQPIIIIGYNAIIKAADGLKYGSFNPVTGEKDKIRKESNITDYYASAYTFINVVDCASITIKGLTLDGNSENLNMGPDFGLGAQLPATGISLYNNKNVAVIDCYIHHCALDAIIIAWTGLKNADPIYPHIIQNVKALYNGRQGLSWVGGNSLKVINSEFSSTGKALNNGKPVVGEPAAGIDIEIENSIIKNGTFINCQVFDNAGRGLSSIGHDTYNIRFMKVNFIGTTNDPAFPKSQNFSFDSCLFVGRMVGICGSEDKTKANFFKNCLFTTNKKASPNGKVFGTYCSFYDAQNVIFDHCTFDAGSGRLPVFSHKEIEFLSCKFIQNSDEDFRAIATFRGTTQFNMSGTGKVDASEGTFQGKIIYNNQIIPDFKNARNK